MQEITKYSKPKTMTKCVYIKPNVLAKALEKAHNNQMSFSRFTNLALMYFMEQYKDQPNQLKEQTPDVDANNICNNQRPYSDTLD